MDDNGIGTKEHGMRRLTLIRHAKSSWQDQSLSDFDRPLNKRGRANAQAMGKRLLEREVRPDMIITSPARRAFATAQIIARKINWPLEQIILEPQLYEAEVDGLAAIIHNLDDRRRHVVLFGHNPGFTDLANWLADADIDNLPTCAVVDLALDIEHWSQIEPKTGRVLHFDFPQKE